MTDTVWPSELSSPYQFDVLSPFVNDTLNPVTSCTYDDGTTVWDIYNGGTTTFDSANQLGTTAPNGERISATWQSSKPSGVDQNPFSLLLTKQEKLDEYCLSFNGVDQQLDFTEKSLTGDFSVKIEFTAPIALSTQALLSRKAAADNYIAIYSDGKINMRFGGNTSNQVDGIIAGKRHVVRFYKVGGVLFIELDGVTTQIGSGSEPFLFDVFGQLNGGLFFGGKLHRIVFEEFYSFNQQSGATVKDLYGSGNDGTLVNSPTFEPVIPNTDYSVGTGDYSTLTAFKAAQQDNTNQSTAIINQNLTESVTFNGTGIINIRNQTPTDFKGAGEVITGTLTLEQDVTLSGVKVDSVVATNGNVEIFNSEIDNVTD